MCTTCGEERHVARQCKGHPIASCAKIRSESLIATRATEHASRAKELIRGPKVKTVIGGLRTVYRFCI